MSKPELRAPWLAYNGRTECVDGDEQAQGAARPSHLHKCRRARGARLRGLPGKCRTSAVSTGIWWELPAGALVLVPRSPYEAPGTEGSQERRVRGWGRPQGGGTAFSGRSCLAQALACPHPSFRPPLVAARAEMQTSPWPSVATLCEPRRSRARHSVYPSICPQSRAQTTSDGTRPAGAAQPAGPGERGAAWSLALPGPTARSTRMAHSHPAGTSSSSDGTQLAAQLRVAPASFHTIASRSERRKPRSR